jgi:hypothetical protein
MHPQVGVIVPSQTVCEFPAPAFNIAAPSSKSFFLSASVVSIGDSPSFSRTFEDESETDPDGLGCMRGLCSAFLFEFGTLLLGYGIWHLWHLAH